jgi:hypothetical protein
VKVKKPAIKMTNNIRITAKKGTNGYINLIH